MLRIGDDADAGRDAVAASFQGDGDMFHFVQQLIGEGLGVLDIRFRYYNGELIAAETRQQVARTGDFAEFFCNNLDIDSARLFIFRCLLGSHVFLIHLYY